MITSDLDQGNSARSLRSPCRPGASVPYVSEPTRLLLRSLAENAMGQFEFRISRHDFCVGHASGARGVILTSRRSLSTDLR